MQIRTLDHRKSQHEILFFPYLQTLFRRQFIAVHFSAEQHRIQKRVFNEAAAELEAFCYTEQDLETPENAAFWDGL